MRTNLRIRRSSLVARRSSLVARRSSLAAGVVGAALASASSHAERPKPFQVIDLGRLGFASDPSGLIGLPGSVAGTFDINDKDQVAYAREVSLPDGSTGVRPFLFVLSEDYGVTQATPIDVLDTFGPSGHTVGCALDINNAGVIVGQLGGTTHFEGQAHAWILDPVDPAAVVHVSFPLPPDTSWSRAVSISESVPWRVVIQTGLTRDCPEACRSGASNPDEHVVSYTVDLEVDGTTSLPVFLDNDSDCEEGLLCWSVEPLGLGFVGSDRRRVLGDCVSPGGPACNDDESGLFWPTPGSPPLDLVDFDAIGPDVQWSEGRDLWLDGPSVGVAVDADAGVCNERAILWTSLGSVDKDLHADSSLSSEDVAFDVFGLVPETWSWAEGVAFAEGRAVVGWDGLVGRGAIWYETAEGSNQWEVLFPGVGDQSAPNGGFFVSPGTVVRDSCEIIHDGSDEDPLDAKIGELYDVNSRFAVVGRIDRGLGVDEDGHLAILVAGSMHCLPGDTDRDGDIDFDDLLKVLADWGACVDCRYCPADVDGNREVGFSDLVTILANFSLDCVSYSGPPQTLQDCIERYGFDPVALEACVSSLSES